jgi:hypothetical protein
LNGLGAICRELGSRVADVHANKIRPMRLEDFQAALTSIRPSVSQNQMKGFEDWTREYGTNA